MLQQNWSGILDRIPQNAKEAVVCNQFVNPLLEALGFSNEEQYPGFRTGQGNQAVDFAARKNNNNASSFLFQPVDPDLLVEVKGRATESGETITLSETSRHYLGAKEQLKKYLLAPKCKTVNWGIITNSFHIQLFRRHGKVIIPATACILIKKENIIDIIANFKRIIDNLTKALTICVYNEKGGVGKTTTTINLAATLWRQHKQVLVVDFDSHRGLTKFLAVNLGKVKLSDCLADTDINIIETVQNFTILDKRVQKNIKIFDIIPADPDIKKYTTYDYEAKIQKGSARLRDLLKIFYRKYDYIIIDCPIEWRFFSKSAIYAADVVLIPTKHSDLQSLDNAANVIKDYIPEVQKQRKDGGPIALPIFFNDSNGIKIIKTLFTL